MFFQKADNWVITNVFEPIAWELEYRTGKGTVSIARFFNFLHPVVMTILLVLLFDVTYYETVVAACMFLVLVSQSINYEYISIRLIERILNNNRGRENPRRMFWKMRLQLILAYLLVTLFIDLLFQAHFGAENVPTSVLVFMSCGAALLLLREYFLSCNPLPPGYEERYMLPHGA